MAILGPCLDAAPLACLSERDGDAPVILPARHSDSGQRVVGALGDGFLSGDVDAAQSVDLSEKSDRRFAVEHGEFHFFSPGCCLVLCLV